jgi:hypothetical protein
MGCKSTELLQMNVLIKHRKRTPRTNWTWGFLNSRIVLGILAKRMFWMPLWQLKTDHLGHCWLVIDWAIMDGQINCCCLLAAESFLVPNPTGLFTIFYCLTTGRCASLSLRTITKKPVELSEIHAFYYTSSCQYRVFVWDENMLLTVAHDPKHNYAEPFPMCGADFHNSLCLFIAS